jgi:hypothetical protein
MTNNFPPDHPRNRGGSIQLPNGEPLTAMVDLGEVLLLYQPSYSYQLRTPDSIDPGGTNPGVPHEVVQTADYGSSNAGLARIFLQSVDMFQPARCSGLDELAAKKLLHAIALDVVVCGQVATSVTSQIEAIASQIVSGNVRRQPGGHALLPPQVVNLRDSCTAFLISAKRSIKAMCSLVALFIQAGDRDNNFRHLSERMKREGFQNQIVLDFLDERTLGTEFVIEHRNAQEHPDRTQLEITNFQLGADGNLRTPSWRRVGQKPTDWTAIATDMTNVYEFLLETAEELFVHLIMHRASRQFPLRVEQIPQGQREPSKPIRFRLSFAV